MNWFYNANGQQIGPIDQAEFKRLVQSGLIKPATLVWREGMLKWHPFDELAALDRRSRAASVVCSECQGFFPMDEVIRLGKGFVCGPCKPLALQKLSEGVTDNEYERIRREHIKHEASVKSVGSLYLLGAIILVMISVVNFLTRDVISGSIWISIAGVLGWVAWGVNTLQPRSRIPAGIISGLGLLGFPIFTIINAYILYLLFCKKGATVFSDDYKQVIAATPHIKYKTSIVVWIVLVIFILLLAASVFGVLWGSSVRTGR